MTRRASEAKSLEGELARLKESGLEAEKKILELPPNQVAQRQPIKQIERELLAYQQALDDLNARRERA